MPITTKKFIQSKVSINLDLEWPWPIFQVLLLSHDSHLGTLPHCIAISPNIITFNISIVLQEKCKCQDHPLQAKDQHTQPTSQLQYHSTIIFPHIGLQLAKEIPGSREDQHRNRALEYRGEHCCHHVSCIPPARPR